MSPIENTFQMVNTRQGNWEINILYAIILSAKKVKPFLSILKRQLERASL